MAATSLDKKIQDYLPLLGNDEKQSLIGVIKSFLKLKETASIFDLEEYNRELEEAEKRIDTGHFVTQEEAEKRSQLW